MSFAKKEFSSAIKERMRLRNDVLRKKTEENGKLYVKQRDKYVSFLNKLKKSVIKNWVRKMLKIKRKFGKQ